MVRSRLIVLVLLFSTPVTSEPKLERSAKAKDVFTNLLESEETPSLDALNLIGKACAATGDSAYAFKVAEVMTGNGVNLTPNFRSNLIVACARSRQGSQQQQVRHRQNCGHGLKKQLVTAPKFTPRLVPCASRPRAQAYVMSGEDHVYAVPLSPSYHPLLHPPFLL